MKKIGTGDVLKITDAVVIASTAGVSHQGGLTKKELYLWMVHRIVVPAFGGLNKGKHARFTPLQVVAITYAAQWWRCGAGLDMIKSIIACVMSHTMEELVAMMKRGEVWAVPLPNGVCFFREASKKMRRDTCILMLDYIYKLVMKELEKLEKSVA